MAKAKANPAAVLKATRREALRFAKRAGKKRLARLLGRAQRDLDRRLKEASGLTGPGADSFTAAQLESMLRQVRAVQADLRAGMKDLVRSQGNAAAQASTASTIDYMERAERSFRGISATLNLKPAAMLDRVVRRTDALVLRRLSMGPAGFKDPKKQRKVKKGIIERYDGNVLRKFEETLQLGVATGKPLADVRAELVTDSPFLQQAPAHWAERIVRTETMAAYNAAGWESVRDANATLGDMVKILAATFDDRTGWDSYGLHGQIRKPDEAFDGFDGRMFMHPPNRPNDREVVIPHRVSWPIPASLEPLSDGEVDARYFEERPNGPGPGARPGMSTVPRESFGKS